jgi:hypothetical protein
MEGPALIRKVVSVRAFALEVLCTLLGYYGGVGGRYPAWRRRRGSPRRLHVRWRIRRTLGLLSNRPLPRPGSHQVILLLELFQPTGAVRLEVAVRVTNGGRKKSGLISNDGIAERKSLSLVVSRPVCKRTFNVRKLALRSFNGRAAAVVLVQVLLFLAQHF